eukprot:gene6889-13167_t
MPAGKSYIDFWVAWPRFRELRDQWSAGDVRVRWVHAHTSADD